MSELKKEKNLFNRVVDLYNPKKVVANWNKTRASPYASLKFQYRASLIVIVAICLYIAYILISLIINYGDGSGGIMTWAGRGAILFVLVIIVIKAFGILTPLKKAIAHYETTPATIGPTHQIDVRAEVDEILSKFDNNGKLIKKKEKITKK